MSADNGVYILETLVPDSKEYRVAHCQNIEDLDYFMGQQVQDDVLLNMFGQSEVYNLEEARQKARDIAAEVASEGPLEYGICLIPLKREFPTYHMWWVTVFGEDGSEDEAYEVYARSAYDARLMAFAIDEGIRFMTKDDISYAIEWTSEPVKRG